MTEIRLNGNVVPPTTQQEGGSHFALDASKSNYILVHCVDRLNGNQYDILRRLQVNVLQYVADNTYLCRFLPTELDEIRRLQFVAYANIYHSDMVVNAILKSKAASVLNQSGAKETAPDQQTSQPQGQTAAAEGSYEVYVVLHPECDRSAADIKVQLTELLGIEADEIYAGNSRLIMNLKAEDLHKVAVLDEVQTIEELPKDEPNNEIARHDLTIPDQMSEGHTVASAEGEIIAVADSGIDRNHTAFTGRLLEPISYRTKIPPGEFVEDPSDPVIHEVPFPDGRFADFSGHGTHIAGSAIGQYTSPNPAIGPIRGTAPDARLLMQVTSEFDNSSCMPRKAENGLQDMFQAAYDAGARLHNNSWSAPPSGDKAPYVQLGYNADATDCDTFMKNHDDFLILCSAGNSGTLATVSGAQVGVHSSCKNVITVGSTQSSRKYSEVPAAFGLISDATGTINGDPNKLSSTSSKGPTIDRRIKPDVVAPGVGICSTRSLLGKALRWDGSKDLNVYGKIIVKGVDEDPNLIYSTGTSMATPLVAGCCAVIRKALRAVWDPPPAPLIKAILINGAVDVRGDAFLQQPPRPSVGFGRVNVARSLLSVNKSQIGGFWPTFSFKLKADDSTSTTVLLPPPPDDPSLESGSTPTKMQMTLSVTMCYNDAPGTVNNGVLVNVLNLRVIASDKTTRYGNTGTTTKDGINNVQKVIWPDISGKTVTFEVKCDSLGPSSQEGQDFYLAYRLDLGPPKNHAAVWNTLNGYLSSSEALLAFDAMMAVSKTPAST